MNRPSGHASRSSFRSVSLAAMEAVEARRLLASVSGRVYDDANANGAREYFEAGRYFDVVYADFNNDGVYNGGDVATRTNAAGYYTLSNLPTGTDAAYSIRLRGDVASRVTSPAGNGYPIPNAGVASYDFGVRPALSGKTTTVGGALFSDANNNGKRDGGEAGVTGRYGSFDVFADLNRNGTHEANEPIAEVNDGASTYAITNVPVGATFDVRFLAGSPADDGGYQTRPAGLDAPLTVTTTAAPLTGADFGFLFAGTLHADAFRDANGNGVVDPSETEPAAGAVWLDLDGDHVRDANEPGVPPTPANIPNNVSARTLGVPFGTYVIAFGPGNAVGTRASVSRTVTLSASEPDAFVKIAVPVAAPTKATLAGRVTSDANNNGKADAGEAGLYFEVVYLDRNRNGTYDTGDVATRTDANGNYAFANVALDGSTVAVRLRGIAAPRSVTAPAGGAYTVTLNASATKTGLNFSVAPAPPMTTTISGTLFDDANGNGRRDAGEGSFNAYYGVEVYADLNRNGRLDEGEPSAYGDDGGYTLANVPVGRKIDVRFGQSIAAGYGDVHQSAPAGFDAPLTLTTTAAPITGADFGFQHGGYVGATGFVDANGNGKIDANERALAGGTTWIDLDGDRRRDAGEPVLPFPIHFYDKTPAPGPTTLGVPYGTFTLAFARSDAAGALADAVAVVTTTPDAPGAFVQIAVPPNSAAATGSVFVDADADGVQDAGDEPLRGATVFADYNNNGKIDAGEPSAAIDYLLDANDGTYYLPVTAGRAFTLRVTSPAYAISKSYPLTLTGKQQAIGYDFTATPSTPKLVTFNGIVKDDPTGSGTLDPSAKGLAGEVVYLDRNHNGIYDGNDIATRTGAYGEYAFAPVVLDGSTIAVRLRGIAAPRAVTSPAGGGFTVTLDRELYYDYIVDFTVKSA